MANLVLNIGPLMKSRGITKPHSYLMRCGITRRVASNLLAGKTKKIDLHVLYRLCVAFRCTVSDLIVVENATEAELQHMPYIGRMVRKEEPKDMIEKLEGMDLEKLKLLQEFLDKM
jgi:DNA-binding Xre family transcriptional regulator